MDYFVKVDGGIGRCIAATGAIKEFAKGKRVYVVTSFDFVFDGLENVERTLVIGTKGIEEKILAGIYTEPEPYNDVSYYLEEKHLCSVFNKLLNGKDDYVAPVVNLTDNELTEAKNFVQQQRNITKTGIVLVQPWSSSGGFPVSPEAVNCDESYRSFSLDTFNKVCDGLLKAGYTPLIIKVPQQMGHARSLTFNNGVMVRGVMALIPFVDGIICCDSFMHHAAAALGNPVPTAVFWGGTSEKNLGFDGQINIHGPKAPMVEPNRIPHDHSYYLAKNKGCNEWTDAQITEAISKMSPPKAITADASCADCKPAAPEEKKV